MSRVTYPKTAKQNREWTELMGVGYGMEKLPPAVLQIVEACEELENQGMEPGAYTVTMEQYLEVAHDLIMVLMAQV